MLIPPRELSRAVKVLAALGLQQCGMRRAIGKHKTVDTELAVVGFVTKVTTVGPHHSAIAERFIQTLIRPIPDKAAL